MIAPTDNSAPCAGCGACGVTHRATLKGGHYKPGEAAQPTKINLVRAMPLSLCPDCAGRLHRRLSLKGWIAQVAGVLVGVAAAWLTAWLFDMNVREGGGKLLILAVPFAVFFFLGAAIGRSVGYYAAERPWLRTTYPWKEFLANDHRVFLRVDAPPTPMPDSPPAGSRR